MYGLLITTGILLGALVCEALAKKQKKDLEIFWGGVIVVILCGTLGARLYHVIDYWEYYSKNLLSIFKIWEGGLGILGGIFGALLGLWVYFIVKKISFNERLEWLDIGVVGLTLGQAIGRFGNHFNNELLPYAYYEAGANFILFLLLITAKILRPNLKEGALFYAYLIGFGLTRWVLGPLHQMAGDINILIALIMIGVGFFGLYKSVRITT